MIDQARIDELRREVGDDDLAEVVTLFCEEFEEALERLNGLQSGSLADDLHFLKGSAYNVGMSQVGELCSAAESRLQDGQPVNEDLALIAEVFRTSRATLLAQLP